MSDNIAGSISAIAASNGLYTVNDQTALQQISELSANKAELSDISKVFIKDPSVQEYADGKQSDLSVVKLPYDEYTQLVVDDETQPNTLYILSGDAFDNFGQQIKNVAPGTELSDAAIVEQVNAVSSWLESYSLANTSYTASVQLANRTITSTTVAAPGAGNTSSVSFTMPKQIAGKSRDFMLNLTFGSASTDAGDISLSFVEPTPTSGTPPSVIIDFGSIEDVSIGKNIILFTEVALPTSSPSATHWLITVKHEDFQ